MARPPIEKKKIPPKPQAGQPQKKKKKNAPDAPQPKWLFPLDEENPVLNPKAKTPEEIQEQKEEREKSLDYMKRRVHAAPDRPTPPLELLTLVGIFLTDFGFNSTSRLFTNEREARKELNGWEDAIGQKIEKGTPKLEQIYREWYLDWKAKKLLKDETSSSESSSDPSDSDSEAGVATQTNGVESSEWDSEASSDGLGGSDVEMKEAPKGKGKKGKVVRRSPSLSSSSDSDADDEAEKKLPKVKTTTVSTGKAKANKTEHEPATALAKPTVTAMVNKLKRKAPSGEEDSDSDSSESSEDEKPAKKTKIAATATTEVASLPNGALSSSSSESEESEESEAEKMPEADVVKVEASSESSSDSSDSDSLSDDEDTKSANVVNSMPPVPKASSDSSATVNGDVKKAAMSTSESDSSSAISSSSSDSDKEPVKTTPVKKEKTHTGAKPTPLAELSARGIQGHVSNQYQSYEYAERAYQDLSVTRGKGFTKEKNKKKRGSYRGGAIDTSGGKGFKFED